MNGMILLAASNPATDIAQQFGFNAQIFLMHTIGFAVVAFLLHRFAYGPILKMLDERKQRIADSMANADKIKSELAQAEATRKQIIEQANIQANKLIEEARSAAAKIQESGSQTAIKTAEEIIAKAREATAADHARMMAELKREVGRLVVETTAKVAGKVLTMDDQKKLAEETSKQLAA